MNKLLLIILILSSSCVYSQAREDSDKGYRSYYIIEITKNGVVQHRFKEGKRIKGKIGDKQVDGVWYFKSEPDIVTVIGLRGKNLGDLNLNNQKHLKLEKEMPNGNGSGISIGVGVGPVGIGTGGNDGGGLRFMTFKMEENKATFGLQKESRKEKIKRDYIEKKMAEQEQKQLTKAAKKAKKKNK